MESLKNILVNPDISIHSVIAIIDKEACQIALVVDGNGRLIGTVTDGDVRRGILRGISLEEPVSKIMNQKPYVVKVGEDKAHVSAIMKAKKYSHMPVVDDEGKVVRLEMLSDLLNIEEKENPVLLMVGGLGERLRPLTDNCPKPLLKVGNKPLLQTIIESFACYGFTNFYLSVNYKAEMLVDYFGDGSAFGVRIQYIHEDKALGTAGALSLLNDKPKTPFFVMNGDILTNVNFSHLLNFHSQHRSFATMCVREYDLRVQYGVVEVDGHSIVGIKEKPVHKFFVNAGIYVLEPEAISLIPPNSHMDMPQLFEIIIERKKQTAVFPVREYWLDIGQRDDFERAGIDCKDMFKR